MDNEKLETDPVYLTELSDLVKYEVVKKVVYDELVLKKLILLMLWIQVN